jgi:hypothetical protein
MTIIGSLVLFLFLLYFPLSYFGFLLDSLTRTAYRSIIIDISHFLARSAVLHVTGDNRRSKSAVKRSRECTLDKEAAGNTSFVSELNGLRKYNSDVV